MIVRIPDILRSYTQGARSAEVAAAATLDEALALLDARYPGLRFRIVDEQAALRPHIRLFVDGAATRDLSLPLAHARELMIVGALSGG